MCIEAQLAAPLEKVYLKLMAKFRRVCQVERCDKACQTSPDNGDARRLAC